MNRRYASPDALLDEEARPATPAGTARTLPSRRARLAILTVVLVVFWLALFGWAADVEWGAPLQPDGRLRYAGSDFHVVNGMGSGFEQGKRLGVNAVGADHTALQSLAAGVPIVARDYPILRYRWEDFPRTLELSFMFRRADEPNDVHTVTLPPAGHFPGYFDLSDVQEWKGDILEIGFAEFPTAQLVPANIAFRPFTLVEAELWSRSWRGSLGALATDWSAYRPWALMSVSALGPDAPWPHKPTPVLLLSIGLVASLVIAALVLARDRRWLGTMLCVAVAGGWLALDLRWIGEFADRHVLTRDLYAGKNWHERAAIEPDTALIASAARVRDLLAHEPASTHVVVAASAVYDMLRLDYHLLPANVAPVGALLQIDATTPMRPTLLVVYDDPTWTCDASRGALHWSDFAYAAEPLLEQGDLRVFRIHGVAP